MNRKIVISELERTIIIAALMAYDFPITADRITKKFDDADPANDGPEVAILRRKP